MRGVATQLPKRQRGVATLPPKRLRGVATQPPKRVRGVATQPPKRLRGVACCYRLLAAPFWLLTIYVFDAGLESAETISQHPPVTTTVSF